MDPQLLVDLSIDRAPYIDQSQSLSLFVAAPTADSLVSFL